MYKMCIYFVVQDNEEGPRLEFLGPGRTVTLQMLLAAKLLEPGPASMTIEYLVS